MKIKKPKKKREDPRKTVSDIASVMMTRLSLGGKKPPKIPDYNFRGKDTIIKSLVTSGQEVGAAKPRMTYTGSKMLGVATMHKSNAVPVFSVEDAKDISKMRRG